MIRSHELAFFPEHDAGGRRSEGEWSVFRIHILGLNLISGRGGREGGGSRKEKEKD
jgi:hypothetical protein